jgi:hypothetical protein
MARSSKPRKAYNPNKHRMHVPMTAQTRDGLALQLHMTVEAMAATPSEALGGKLARILAAMANAINYQSPETDPRQERPGRTGCRGRTEGTGSH